MHSDASFEPGLSDIQLCVAPLTQYFEYVCQVLVPVGAAGMPVDD